MSIKIETTRRKSYNMLKAGKSLPGIWVLSKFVHAVGLSPPHCYHNTGITVIQVWFAIGIAALYNKLRISRGWTAIQNFSLSGENVSWMCTVNEWNIFQHSTGKWVLPGHFTFASKATFHYATIVTVIFLHVSRYRVFAQRLTWYFISVYITTTKKVQWFMYLKRIYFKIMEK